MPEAGIEKAVAYDTLGPYLHDLGKVLFFSDDPLLRAIIVLKPNWITKVISQVLQYPALQISEGILSVHDLPRIWARNAHGQSYDDRLYALFIRLMQRFGLCFALDTEPLCRSSDRYLIPLLLPDQPPKNLNALPDRAHHSQKLLTLHYQLSFIPSGLVSWLLVRTHCYGQNLYWRSGARFKFQGQQAEIELDEDKMAYQGIVYQGMVRLNAWGLTPFPLLLILKVTLDELLERFKGLKVRRMIPCICGEHDYEYNVLSEKYERGITQVHCRNINTLISSSRLLYGISTNLSHSDNWDNVSSIRETGNRPVSCSWRQIQLARLNCA